MLRWYPRRWRKEHGPALVGIYLDAAADEGDGLGRLSGEQKSAIRTAGLFERTRYALPIAAAIAGTLSTAVGMVLATLGFGTLGPLLWLVAGPILISSAFWALRAAFDGRWSPSTGLPAIFSAAAFSALGCAFWIAVLRDQMGAGKPSIVSLWTFGALYLALAGIAGIAAITPSLVRKGMRREWGLPLAFFLGLGGAVAAALVLLSGVGVVLAGAALTWWAIRSSRRRDRHSALA